jgi:hypothetical protein
VMAIGSGGPYALAAARAMVRYSELTATEIAREAVKIASEICIYTNDRITVEEIDLEEEQQVEKDSKKTSGTDVKSIPAKENAKGADLKSLPGQKGKG